MLNSVSIIGRLAYDPKYTKGDNYSNARLTLACQREYKDKEGNYPVDFLNATVWGSGADYINQYGRKGDLVSIHGRLQVNTFENADGELVYYTEIYADSVAILSKPKNKESEDKEDFSTYKRTDNKPSKGKYRK